MVLTFIINYAIIQTNQYWFVSKINMQCHKIKLLQTVHVPTI